jgi:nucleoside-diphosphate-sugar epimerase
MRILITGIAGTVGVELAAELAEQGHAVLGTVNRNAGLVKNDGTVVAARMALPSDAIEGSIVLFKADVTKPMLGMSSEDYQALASGVDLIIHSAAITDFGRPKEVYEAVNVEGTKNVLALAQAKKGRPTPFLHISTAYVCGQRQGRVLEEDLEMGQTFVNDYEESKYRAERLVHEAMAKGLPAVIARPSIIVGHSQTGCIRDFKTMYVVLRVLSQGKVRSMPGNYGATLDLVPIDTVCERLLRIVEGWDWCVGKTFHIVGAVPITLRDMSDVMAEYPWCQVPRFVPQATFDEARLPPKEQRFYGRVMRLYDGYFRRQINFDDAEMRALCGSRRLKPEEAATWGKSLMRRLMDYSERVDYLGNAPIAPRVNGANEAHATP